jgi:hypothetical protein
VTAEQAHLLRVKQLSCVLCRHLGLIPQDEVQGMSDAHHLFRPEDRSDWLVAPLCKEHHQGATGFHGLGGEPGFRRRYKLGEAQLLAMTLRRLFA